MFEIRYWISAKLLGWAISVLPDPYSKACLEAGVQVTAELLMQGLEDDTD